MKLGDRILLFAALAGSVALVLGAASMTLAVVVLASPPAPGAGAPPAIWLMIPASAMSMVVSAWAIAQVALRRPTMSCPAPAGRIPTAGRTSLILYVVAVVLILPALLYSVADIAVGSGSKAVPGLVVPLGILSNLVSGLSSQLFFRWWNGSVEGEAQATADTAARPAR